VVYHLQNERLRREDREQKTCGAAVRRTAEIEQKHVPSGVSSGVPFHLVHDMVQLHSDFLRLCQGFFVVVTDNR
jgi:hypothetical protein